MHGRISVTRSASAVRPGCEDCLLAPECPARALDGAGSDRGIEVAIRILHRGDRLFRYGEAFDSIYMMRSGTIKACTISASGDEQVIGFYASGDLVGLDAIHAGRHMSSAIALGTTSVCSLPFEPLRRVSARRSHVQRRLLVKMSQRIASDGHRLAILAMRGAGQRMAAFLIALVDSQRSRGLKCDEIHLPMSRTDIASYLVLAVETVSRSLSRQHEKGLIKVHRNRIRVLDEQALRTNAGCQEPKTPAQAHGAR